MQSLRSIETTMILMAAWGAVGCSDSGVDVPSRDAETKASQVPTVELPIGTSTDCKVRIGGTVYISITDKETFDRCIALPCRSAEPITDLQRWESVGEISFRDADGTKKMIYLFRPLGLIRFSDRYYRVKFRELRTRLHNDLTNASMIVDEM